MYSMKNNDEKLVVDKILKSDEFFQKTMIVQMDMELNRHHLCNKSILFIPYSNRIIQMYVMIVPF